MNFKNEKAFEEHIKAIIKKHILPKKKKLILFENKKTVDILICKNGQNPALYFLEIKYHKKSHGRLPTGHGKGGGFQPEVLSKLPSYFENNMRWILGAEDKKGYWLLKNSEIASNLSGNNIGIKHNNIAMKIFVEFQSLSKTELTTKLIKFLK